MVDIRDTYNLLTKYKESKIVFHSINETLSYTYRSLQTLVDKKIQLLSQLDLYPNSRIGILADNSIDWMAWDIAISHKNHVSVIFIAAHKGISYSELLEKYACSLIITDDAEHPGSYVVNIKENKYNSSMKPLLSEGHEKNNIDTYSMVFSSGTTGRIKGLYISESGLNSTLLSYIQSFQISYNDKYYSFLSFSYFQQRALYYAAISQGNDICISTPENFLSGFKLFKPSYTVNPPIFYEMINNYHELSSDNESLVDMLGGNIRWMITAMAPIQLDVLNWFWDNNIKLFETYGVTETGLVTWNTPSDFKIGTVGKVALDAEVLLTDESEILIKRDKPLSLGYFDVSTELESETFLPSGYLSTGDIASIDDEGYITLIGRSKNSIVTKEGKKFHPELLEEKIKNTINTDVTPIVFNDRNDSTNYLLISVSKNSILDTEISKIKDVNSNLESYKRIDHFYITHIKFSPENNYLTRNYKLNRTAIIKDFFANELTNRIL